MIDAFPPYLRSPPRCLLFPHVSHPRPWSRFTVYYLSIQTPPTSFSASCMLPLSSTSPDGPPLVFGRSFGLAAFPCDLEVPPCLTYWRTKAAQIASMLASLPLGFILLTHFRVLQALSPLPSSASPFWSLVDLLSPPSLSSNSLVRIGCGQVDKRLLRGSAGATRCGHGVVGGRSGGGLETRVGDDENERRVRQSTDVVSKRDCHYGCSL